MSLSIYVATGSPVPIYRQIVDQVVSAIGEGRLVEGEPLPGARTLAEQLRINSNTVVRAYSELVREGFIEAQSTRGMFVAQRRNLYSKPERRRRIEHALEAFISEAVLLGFTPEEMVAQVEERAEELARNRTVNARGSR